MATLSSLVTNKDPAMSDPRWTTGNAQIDAILREQMAADPNLSWADATANATNFFNSQSSGTAIPPAPPGVDPALWARAVSGQAVSGTQSWAQNVDPNRQWALDSNHGILQPIKEMAPFLGAAVLGGYGLMNMGAAGAASAGADVAAGSGSLGAGTGAAVGTGAAAGADMTTEQILSQMVADGWSAADAGAYLQSAGYALPASVGAGSSYGVDSVAAGPQVLGESAVQNGNTIANLGTGGAYPSVAGAGAGTSATDAWLAGPGAEMNGTGAAAAGAATTAGGSTLSNWLTPSTVISGLSNLAGAYYSSNAADKAAKAQADSATAALAENKRQYDLNRSDSMPWLTAGANAEGRLADLTGVSGNTGATGYGSLVKPFDSTDLANDPVYNSGLDFGLKQGIGGINARAIQSGGYDSGATLKELTRYANDYGSTKANDSFNRYNTNQTNAYNRLAGVSGAGQNQVNNVMTAGGNLTNSNTNLQTGIGNANAAGIVSGANAWGNAATNFSNTVTSQSNSNQEVNYLKQLLARQNGGTYYGS